MTWGKLGPKGWGSHKDDTSSGQSGFTQIIRAIVEVVPGGVIRAVKRAFADDDGAGWWLGVDSDGVAKLNIGDGTQFLKWTGERVSVRGDLALQALLGKYDGGGVVWEDAAGDPVLTIGAEVDLGAITRLVIDGQHAAGLRISSSGSLTLVSDEGAVDVLFCRLANVGDATADGDAVSRSFGDGRYLAKGAGWTGTLTVGTQTVTVVNGQITGVA